MTAYIDHSKTPLFPDLKNANYILVCGDGEAVEIEADTEAEVIEFAENFVRQFNKADLVNIIRLDPKRYAWCVLSHGTYRLMEVAGNAV